MDEQNIHNIESRVALVLILYSLAQVARFRGLLALEDYMHLAKIEELRSGLSMTIQGEDPESVKDHYDGLIDAAKDEDRKGMLLTIQQGVGMIASGQDPELLRWQLSWQPGEDMAEAVIQTLQEILIGHENNKRDLFSEMTRVSTEGDLADRVEEAFVYEFAWGSRLVSSVVSLEVLCTAVRGCGMDIQMRIVHLLPLLDCDAFMTIYRSGEPAAEQVETAMNEFMDWYRYVRGQGGYPGVVA